MNTAMAARRHRPEQRRAIIATAVSLALVALVVYISFIVMTGLN
ncbi:MAG: hypothetical protein U5K33_02935 [Halofilum sp. (in: g-proteobacteria)]|nr:hypothetical protein [Halofilum sp. (in: g-proteobacteria)]